MLALNLKPVLQARGIDRPYTFLVKTGLSPHSATTILNSNTRVFRLDHIERICEHLNCTPNDILYWKPDKNKVISPNHPMFALKKEPTSFDWHETLKNLPLEQLNEIAAVLGKISQNKT